MRSLDIRLWQRCRCGRLQITILGTFVALFLALLLALGDLFARESII